MDSFLDKIYALQKEFEDTLPPVHLWSPELSGDLDMRIDREGGWYYQGSKINRHSLVKLFSSILKKEGDEYFLVTPVEKWRIRVDVAPFLIVAYRKLDDRIVLETNVGSTVLLDEDHPLTVSMDKNKNPVPLVMVHRGLQALINRPVYYDLVELADFRETDAVQEAFIKSGKSEFSLGRF